jgi:hypothetical protein
MATNVCKQNVGLEAFHVCPDPPLRTFLRATCRSEASEHPLLWCLLWRAHVFSAPTQL